MFSISQSKPANSQQESKKYVAVKSRLFDYLHKPGKTLTVRQPSETAVRKPSENTKPKQNTKRDAVKPTNNPKPAVSVKSGLKRRHSEISYVPPKKPAGILKRKSCIPSIEKNCDNEANLATSDIGDNAGAQGDEDDVFMSEANFKDIPVAMVTPSTARSVRFISPDDRVDGHKAKLRKTPLKPNEMR